MARETKDDNTDELFPFGRKPSIGGVGGGQRVDTSMGPGLKLPQKSSPTLHDRIGSPTITGSLKMARTKAGTKVTYKGDYGKRFGY